MNTPLEPPSENIAPDLPAHLATLPPVSAAVDSIPALEEDSSRWAALTGGTGVGYVWRGVCLPSWLDVGSAWNHVIPALCSLAGSSSALLPQTLAPIPACHQCTSESKFMSKSHSSNSNNITTSHLTSSTKQAASAVGVAAATAAVTTTAAAAKSSDSPFSVAKLTSAEWWGKRLPGDTVKHLIAGGIAGAVSRTVVSPLERMKIMMQVQGPGGRHRSGVFHNLAQIYREEGFVGYLRGNGANVIRIVPYSAVQFATYEYFKVRLRHPRTKQLNTHRRLAAGALAGIASVACTYPLDLVRTRLSMDQPAYVKTRNPREKPPRMMGMMWQIWRTEGRMRGLYQGFIPTILGVTPYVAINFTAYEWFRAYFTPAPTPASPHPTPSVPARLACGALAGTVAQTATYPLELLRRRMQVTGMEGAEYKYRGMWHAVVTIVRTEGWRRLYADAIRVVCRFRPQNSREIKEGGVPVVSFDDEMSTVKFDSKDYPGTFTFDRIFDWNASQEDVFNYAAGATIEDVMRGYNGTIFAYGQTGSGKTHTMMGDVESEELRGLTPRLVESIFSTIFNAPTNLEFTVRVSYMEIYMEKIRDLLNPANDNLPIHEEKNRGVYVKGLLEVFVGSVAEVYDVMTRGQGARAVSYTNMNAESSRSHSIFVITISQKNLNDGSQRSGKLYLVDLAGSEKVGKTGASGQTLEEAKKINKSLSALGMVINALTDGKSSHIPYRDSKLTRILQESLGGNSRTTLIINCSPSSFNEAETTSTLRFGMRAKTIKNKAKINAELSPAELKALLKKSKTDLTNLQNYCGMLEGELTVWRSGRITGGTVPQGEWVTSQTLGGDKTPLSAIPGHLAEIAARAATPAPGPALTDDEREELLRRENELSDQLAEKDAELKNQLAAVTTMTEELAFLKTKESETAAENKELNNTLSDLRVQLEKVSFENKESTIMVDTLKDANAEMAKEMELLKQQIIELQAAKPTAQVSEEDKEKKKQEKMAQMMAEFDPSASMTDKEKQIRDNLAKLAHMKETSKPPTTPEEIEAQHLELLEAKTQVATQEAIINDLISKAKTAQDDVTLLSKRKEELESKLSSLEREYEELLDKTIQEEEQNASTDVVNAFEDLKSKLELQYNTKRELQEKEVEDLKNQLHRKEDELAQLQTENQKTVEELKTTIESMKTAAPAAADGAPAPSNEEVEKLRKTMAQQLGEFDAMKKKLMRELQNRCEKVVELEISLDETREQYNNILRNSNSRAQQQKMAFLERNLEQLTSVQKQLVEQNSTLKKELAVAERKLVARNERIQNLETLLHDAQTKLELQNQKFEAQLKAMREKLQDARSANQPSSSWLYSSRIARPLRGGGAVPVSGDTEDSIGDADSAPPTPSLSTKRSSWYINLLKK
ncbi:hypothetical protein HK104_005564 [Borealophlyctis nickersoniae]|nr:hypothetical protein HK104_005564 [Borealophlyctis nickersoniae]